jgi:predicted nucleic acid-binding protein
MLLDTSAWIELFDGTGQGKIVKETLKRGICYTSIVSLAEIAKWSYKEKRDLEVLIDIIEESSLVVDLNKEIALLAGKLNFERKKINKKWGMVDSFILATALHYNLKILSKDSDFSDLKDAEMLPK